MHTQCVDPKETVRTDLVPDPSARDAEFDGLVSSLLADPRALLIGEAEGVDLFGMLVDPVGAVCQQVDEPGLVRGEFDGRDLLLHWCRRHAAARAGVSSCKSRSAEAVSDEEGTRSQRPLHATRRASDSTGSSV